jgi:5-keto 4-deoxyuronate isomerase
MEVYFYFGSGRKRGLPPDGQPDKPALVVRNEQAVISPSFDPFRHGHRQLCVYLGDGGRKPDPPDMDSRHDGVR